MPTLGRVLRSLLLLSVASVSGAATGVFRDLAIPGSPGGATQLVGFAYAYWFTEFDANRIATLTRDGQFQEFPVPTPNSGPHGIALGSNNAVWFTELKAGKIGRLASDGTITEYAIPTPQSAPWGIVPAENGGAWFTESAGNKIGRLNADGSVIEYAIPTPNASSRGITAVEGGVCFAEFGADRLGCLVNGQIVEVALTPGSGPQEFSSDGGAHLWFTETTGNRIGVLSFGFPSDVPHAALQEIPIPTPASEPLGIVADFSPGAGAWFSERAAGQIGFMSADFRITEYPLPDRASQPTGITLSLFGAEFLESRAGRLAEVRPDAVVAAGVGTSGPWRTAIEVSNVLPRPLTVFAGISVRPSGISIEGSLPEPAANLPPGGSARFDLGPSNPNGLFTYYVRGEQEAELPSVRARIFNADRPGQSAVIPTIRLSTLTSLNPSTLSFPGAARGGGARTNLMLCELTREDGDFAVGAFRIVSLRVDLFDADGNAVASKTVEFIAGRSVYIGDVVGWLGVTTLPLGQIRVTRIDDRSLIWGYAATIDSDGAVSIVGGLTP